ncbi:MAG: carboxylesterase family protein [Faecalibacterium sp.]
MAREGDCVVVSLNHRLNILGYLDLSDFGEEYANSGNAGGDDIILALQWVRDNIAAFGGDPGCVTVFGQSGGGAKVTTLLQTPAADGLYHRAMIMSGVLEGLLNDSVGSGRDCVQALMQELGVQTAQQLETVPYHQLAQAYRNVSPALKAKGANVGQSPHPNRFYLGDPLHNGSGFRPETADVPVLIGTVYSEFYGFFDGLKGVGPEEAVGLSAAETLREQFRTAYPHRPEEDLLAGRYQLPRPHDQICPGACQGGRKGVQLSV